MDNGREILWSCDCRMRVARACVKAQSRSASVGWPSHRIQVAIHCRVAIRVASRVGSCKSSTCAEGTRGGHVVGIGSAVAQAQVAAGDIRANRRPRSCHWATSLELIDSRTRAATWCWKARRWRIAKALWVLLMCRHKWLTIRDQMSYRTSAHRQSPCHNSPSAATWKRRGDRSTPSPPPQCHRGRSSKWANLSRSRRICGFRSSRGRCQSRSQRGYTNRDV